MQFKDIIGQDLLKSRLVKTVYEDRLSHAWLFFGEEGTGSLPVSLAFASFILCTNRSAGDSCGMCAACKKTSKYIHPDLHFVMPVNRIKAVDRDNITSDDLISYWREFLQQNPYGSLIQWYDFIDLDNKQGKIDKEESKKIATKMSLKSFESDYKILIIWHPEKMNDASANMLLKLLEEPPPMTVFLLICDNPDQLLGTIRSRCIQIKVPRITDADLFAHLSEHHQMEVENANEVTRLAEGNYLKALNIIEDEGDSALFFDNFRELMRSCYKPSIPEIIKHAENLSALTREKQKSFLEYGLRTIRECMVLHFEEGDIQFFAQKESKFTRDFSPFVNGANVVGLTNELNYAIRDIERNGNGRIIFLDLGLKLSALIRQTRN